MNDIALIDTILAEAPNPDGLSLNDLLALSGKPRTEYSRWIIRGRLQELVRDNRVEAVKGYRVGVDGRRITVPLYRLVKRDEAS